MIKIEPGLNDNQFNITGLTALEVERFLGVLSEQERKTLGKEPGNSHTLNAVAKVLEATRKTAQIVDNANKAPEGTTAPPANG